MKKLILFLVLAASSANASEMISVDTVCSSKGIGEIEVCRAVNELKLAASGLSAKVESNTVAKIMLAGAGLATKRSFDFNLGKGISGNIGETSVSVKFAASF